MPRDTLICVSCRCEIERIEIAGGRVMAMCAGCEGYADAAEFAQGAPLSAVAPLPESRSGGVVIRLIRALVPRASIGKSRILTRRAS
jgi:hypothetical protein